MTHRASRPLFNIFRLLSEPAVREQVASALFSKGVCLAQLGRLQDEMGTYDEVVSRFGQASEPALQRVVANALFNKGMCLGQLGHVEPAIAACDAVVGRFGNAADIASRERVGAALLNKGLYLSQLGRVEDAVAAYDAVLRRGHPASSQDLRNTVAEARRHRAAAKRPGGFYPRTRGGWVILIAVGLILAWSAAHPRAPVVPLGHGAVSGPWKVTVLGVSSAQFAGLGLLQQAASGKYLLVNLSLGNATTSPKTPNIYTTFALTRASDTYAPSSVATSPISVWISSLNPGESESIQVAFDVPAKWPASAFRLHVPANGRSFSLGEPAPASSQTGPTAA